LFPVRTFATGKTVSKSKAKRLLYYCYYY